jgi:hypothetical protein
MEPLFPDGTFDKGQVDLDFICSETQPPKGAANLHTQVVLGGGKGGATDAMKEWATLGWYGMAVFAIARANCCPDAAPLSTPTSLGHCKLDETLMHLGKVTLTPGDDDPAEQAMLDFTRAVNCLVRGGATELFGQEGYPKGGEVTSFKKTYLRARRLAMKK